MAQIVSMYAQGVPLERLRVVGGVDDVLDIVKASKKVQGTP
jgi:hypothetical protein